MVLLYGKILLVTAVAASVVGAGIGLAGDVSLDADGSGATIGGDADGKVTLCHVPPGNPGNAHTIHVGAAAVKAHLRHGDRLGACDAEVAVDVEVGDDHDDPDDEHAHETGAEHEPAAEDDEGFGTQEVPACECGHHEADVGVSKAVKVTDEAGRNEDRVDYKIVVESVGDADATDVRLEDDLHDFGGTWVLGGSAAESCALSGDRVTCAFGALAPGETRTIVLSSALCEIGCGADIVNTVFVSAENDVDESNNAASATVPRSDCPAEPEDEPERPDARVSKSVEATFDGADDVVRYTLAVESVGDAAVAELRLEDELPALQGSWSISGPDADACDIDAGVLSCDLGTLAVDGSVVVLLTAETALDCGVTVTNTATIASRNDVNSGNDQATVAFDTPTCADVALAKNATVTDEGSHHETVVFSFVVSNEGEETATTVVLTDGLPDFGTEWTLEGEAADECLIDGQNLTCAFGGLAGGASLSVAVRAELCEVGCGDDVVNTARVGADDDADLSNNEASATVAREPCP